MSADFEDPIDRMASLDADEWAFLNRGGRPPGPGVPVRTRCQVCGEVAVVVRVGVSRGPDPTEWRRLDCGHTVIP